MAKIGVSNLNLQKSLRLAGLAKDAQKKELEVTVKKAKKIQDVEQSDKQRVEEEFLALQKQAGKMASELEVFIKAMDGFIAKERKSDFPGITFLKKSRRELVGAFFAFKNVSKSRSLK